MCSVPNTIPIMFLDVLRKSSKFNSGNMFHLHRMIPTDKYISNNSLQVEGVASVLNRFKSKMKWTDTQKVIDIGCGPGDASLNYILPLIGSDGQMVGIDKSCSMIDRAKNLNADSRSSFQVFDITGSEIAEKFESYFDSALSFHCLSWTRDHRAAMENIYSILKPGGEALLTWTVDCINFSLWETLAASPKWSLYMSGYKDVISLNRDSCNPVSEVTNLMQQVGFQVDECSVYLNYHTFPSEEHFYKWVDGVNPFLKNVPAHLLKEYNRESKKILWDKRLFFSPTLNELTNEVVMKYSSILVLARK